MTHIILDNHQMLTVRRELVVNRPSVSSVDGATMPFMTKDKRNLVDTHPETHRDESFNQGCVSLSRVSLITP